MNSHSEGELKPNLPEPLLAGLDPHRRWLYEQVSMQGQQNTEILRRLEAGNQRFDTINRALEQHFKDDAKQFGALNQNVNALVAQATVRRRVWRWVVGGVTAAVGVVGTLSIGDLYAKAKSLLEKLF